jgi:hypothetical protein
MKGTLPFIIPPFIVKTYALPHGRASVLSRSSAPRRERAAGADLDDGAGLPEGFSVVSTREDEDDRRDRRRDADEQSRTLAAAETASLRGRGL